MEGYEGPGLYLVTFLSGRMIEMRIGCRHMVPRPVLRIEMIDEGGEKAA